MEPELGEIVKILQGGGNAALVFAVYFIYKAANRLARIEVILEILLTRASESDGALRFRKTDIHRRRTELEAILKDRERDE